MLAFKLLIREGLHMTLDERLIDIEMAIANQQKIIDDLNDVIIKQGKTLDLLAKENKLLLSLMRDDNVKPLSEELPPPHY